MSASIGILLAAPLISWSGLGLVALVAGVAAAILVTAFSFALIGLDRWSALRNRQAAENGGGEAASGTGDIAHAAMPIGVRREQVAFGSLAMAIVGFAVCVAGVGLGLWSMVEKVK